MALSNIILFVSTLSKECNTSLKYIKNSPVPIQIVRLDTAETRNRAANGKYFQVRMVPTMVIHYKDGNMEVFIGNTKIIPILSSMLQDPTSRSEGSPGQETMPLSFYGASSPNIGTLTGIHPVNMYGTSTNGTNMYNSVGTKPSKPVYIARSTPISPNGEKHNSPQIIDYDYPLGKPNHFNVIEDDPKSFVSRYDDTKDFVSRYDDPNEEDSLDIHPVYDEPEEIVVVKKPKTKSKKKGKKKPPVVFEEDLDDFGSLDDDPNVEIEIEERLPRNVGNKGGASSKKMKNSRMQGLIDKAKNLEQERQSSLGYDEADLPHY
jgi:hypothetical protein